MYAGFLAFIYLLAGIAGVALMVFSTEMATPQEPAEEIRFMGGILALMGLVFFGAFMHAVFLPRTPGNWTYAAVLIGLGLTSPCFIPVCLPLMIYWFKPEVQAYFGRMDAAPAPPSNYYR